MHGRTPAREAGGREFGRPDLQAPFAAAEGERPGGVPEHGSGLAARLGLDLDRGDAGRGQDESETALGSGVERPDTDRSLPARRPQHGAREEGVLVLPVVPIGAGLHRVDGLGDEAVAHRGEGHHAAPAVRAGRDHGEPARFDRHVALRLVLVEAAAARARGQEVEVEAVGDRVRPRPPLAFRDGLPVGLGIPAVAHPVVGHADERRDLPDPLVALLLVAEEGVPLHVPHEGVEEHEPGPLAHPPQDRVAGPAGVTRPAVEAGDHEHLERLLAQQLLLDVAVDDPEVVPVAAEDMVAVVPIADAPAVHVPAAVDRDRGRLEGEPLHQLDHVAALGDRGHEEPPDGPAGQPLRPRYVRRHDRGREGDVVADGGRRRTAQPGHGARQRQESGDGHHDGGPKGWVGAHGKLRDPAAPRLNSAAESRSR